MRDRVFFMLLFLSWTDLVD